MSNKYGSIPWSNIIELSKLTYLIYSASDILQVTDSQYNSLDDSSKNLLKSFQEANKTSKILHFFTNHADMQCAIGVNEDTKKYMVIFRGSESFKDWTYNLMVMKTCIQDDIYVHKGFYKQLHYNNTYTKILQFIKTQNSLHPDYEWYVAGHSLGGALSTLFGYMLSKNMPNLKIVVVSLASPRVGNKAFKHSFEEQPNLFHYRLCNNRDSFTAVPNHKYYHVGQNIYYSSKKNEWIVDQDSKMSYTLLRCYNPLDHFCTRYITRLEQWFI